MYNNFIVLILLLVLVFCMMFVLKFLTGSVSMKIAQSLSQDEKLSVIKRSDIEIINKNYLKIINLIQSNNINQLRQYCSEEFIELIKSNKVYIHKSPSILINSKVIDLSDHSLIIELLGRTFNNEITENVEDFLYENRKFLLHRIFDYKVPLNIP